MTVEIVAELEVARIEAHFGTTWARCPRAWRW